MNSQIRTSALIRDAEARARDDLETAALTSSRFGRPSALLLDAEARARACALDTRNEADEPNSAALATSFSGRPSALLRDMERRTMA